MTYMGFIGHLKALHIVDGIEQNNTLVSKFSVCVSNNSN